MRNRTVLSYRGNTQNSDGQTTVNAHQHANALEHRYTSRHFGSAIRKLLEGWEDYAQAHQQAYESPVGDDGYAGQVWADLGKSLQQLLTCELGGWDAGSLDRNIRDLAAEQGFDRDTINKREDA